jgi:4,4'-diaponeurosporenoate glycosyltransferase
VTSIQPWHETEGWFEQASVLCNVTALMGCGAFTPAGRATSATVAFGPVLGVERVRYDQVGGHAHPSVRSMHTEDIGLARVVGQAELYTGHPDTSFRMYPEGLGQTVRGWTRSIATGARFTPWWVALATLAWVWSLAGGWIAMPIVYPLSALQVWVLGRRAASIHPLTAILYPVAVVAFVIIFLRSLVALTLSRRVEWKGRRVDAR